nr:unnamed protein product [Callosobruchus analis]
MNIQSIRNKFDEIQCFVINNPCDVLVLSETWLCDGEASFYNLNGYKVVHACRQKRGGRVTFYVKEGIYFQEIGRSKSDDLFNHLTIGICFNSLKLTAVYKHPSYSVNVLNNFENLLIAHPQNHIIIVKNNPLSDHNRLNIIIKQKIKIYQKKCTYESLSMSHKKFVSLFEQKCESIGINSFQQLIQTVQTLLKKR